MTKNDRLELRLTEQQKADIERAAAISGRSVTDVSAPVLVKEAADVTQHERDLLVSQQAWEAFKEAAERPAQTVGGFARLLRRRSVFVD